MIAGGAVSLSAGFISPSNAAAERDPGILDKPEELLTAFMRLSGSLDDRLIIWWMEGLRYGVVDARAKLLFGMQVGMFHRFFRQADGVRVNRETATLRKRGPKTGILSFARSMSLRPVSVFPACQMPNKVPPIPSTIRT